MDSKQDQYKPLTDKEIEKIAEQEVAAWRKSLPKPVKITLEIPAYIMKKINIAANDIGVSTEDLIKVWLAEKVYNFKD
jgi:hypothetical protein